LVLAAEDIADPMDPQYPSFLAEINGSTPLQNWIENAVKLDASLHLAVSKQDKDKYRLVELMSSNQFPVNLVEIRGRTAGATCTALLAVADLDSDDSLLVLNGNEMLAFDFGQVIEGFATKAADAGVAYFESVHPRYSFIRINEQGEVTEASEKKPISRNATAGFYWFKRARDFIAAAEAELLKNSSVDGHFYICPLFNELILEGKVVQSHQIMSSDYKPLKSARQASIVRNVRD
jgi:dTDP-glucose pyrophosphorylase